VTLNWHASTSANVTGYNVYRGTQSGGPYAKVNTVLDTSTTEVDYAVTAGQTYYYVVTAVNASSQESAYSTQIKAVIPYP
jgi:fibronectin type 3 domain-containing protein